MSTPSPDSPLSITASIAGILTLGYAILAGALGYSYLFRSLTRSTGTDIERFYEAFAACALETDLVRRDIVASQRGAVMGVGTAAATTTTTTSDGNGNGVHAYGHKNHINGNGNTNGNGNDNAPPHEEPYLLDPDSLGRLFAQVRAVEIELQNQAAKVIKTRPTRGEEGLLSTLLGRGRWLGRSKELEESLKKREALTARLLVIQIALVSARLHSQGDVVSQLKTRIALHEKEIEALKEKLGEYARHFAKDDPEEGL